MTYESAHEAPHFINRSGWLRAAVLGANGGIVSVNRYWRTDRSAFVPVAGGGVGGE